MHLNNAHNRTTGINAKDLRASSLILLGEAGEWEEEEEEVFITKR